MRFSTKRSLVGFRDKPGRRGSPALLVTYRYEDGQEEEVEVTDHDEIRAVINEARRMEDRYA